MSLLVPANGSKAALGEARRLLAAAGVRFDSVAGVGRLAETLADIARRSRADQIVLGEGRSGVFERYAVPACVGVGVTLLIAAE